MKVKLRHDWFAPTELSVQPDTRVFSGRFYRRGVHEFPEDMREYLPKSATIVGEEKVYEDSPSDSLADFDHERAAAESEGDIVAEAERTIKRGRRPSKPKE